MEEKRRELTGSYETGHIGVLDGVRVLAVGLVVWFHFWQQSWLSPQVGELNLDWLPRTGYLMVDMMIFLSGFCLFLPYARSMVYAEETQRVSAFYVKRAARILPSYYAAVVIALIFALFMGAYGNGGAIAKDLVPHVFLVHNFFPASTMATKLNGVLWTVAVEAQLYVLFPLFAKFFQKKPMPTYIGMSLIGVLSSYFIGQNMETLNPAIYVNHLLTFISVFANGFLAAWIYVSMTEGRQRKKAEEILWTGIAIICVYVYFLLTKELQSASSGSKWQVENRYLLSLVFMLFVIAVMFSAKWFRRILDNRVMAFLSGISYNLYIWHQYIAVKFKEFRIPHWDGECPNKLGDRIWQWKYVAGCLLLSLFASVVMTYLLERPLSKKILALYNRHVLK